jgi:hypothetical protein
VCVLDGPHKKAYLKRENSFIVSKLIIRWLWWLSNYWLLKPKEDPVVRNRRTGPQQRSSIGCKTSASAAKLDEVASLFEVGIIFELKDLIFFLKYARSL